ncbi:hypothetical protein FE257_005820 [Aspergillus nanangensis]|uniref:Uncharacterized protein n=1 Tax=Aspergillus nanangensis TaxID=2582783 RepID=A0AAD4CB54_ASPNN|nr:hypothetical protein FE257_005820 [Aspergillus nanangensis]
MASAKSACFFLGGAFVTEYRSISSVVLSQKPYLLHRPCQTAKSERNSNTSNRLVVSESKSTSEKDYSYTSPLSSISLDFPYKSYGRDLFVAVTNYTAGQKYPLTLAGTATHGGNSCQVSLSYDYGESFRVIKSIVGRCPESLQYTFHIPKDAPHGPALLAWTWFNKIGNREMYMNYAQVSIQGPPANAKPGTSVRQRSAGQGQCSTIEGEEVNFPMPGDNVDGSVQGVGYQCNAPAAFLNGRDRRTALDPSTSVSPIPSSAPSTGAFDACPFTHGASYR